MGGDVNERVRSRKRRRCEEKQLGGMRKVVSCRRIRINEEKGVRMRKNKKG